MRVVVFVPVGDHIGRAIFQLPPMGCQCPRRFSIGANRLAIVLDYPGNRKLVVPAVFDTFVGDPCLRRHFAHETIYAGLIAGAFDAKRNARSNGHNPTNNSRAKNSIFRKTK